jgi:hypothetical protein
MIQDEELQASKVMIMQLNELLQESERTEQLYIMQLKTLKDEIRELERSSKRNGQDLG